MRSWDRSELQPDSGRGERICTLSDCHRYSLRIMRSSLRCSKAPELNPKLNVHWLTHSHSPSQRQRERIARSCSRNSRYPAFDFDRHVNQLFMHRETLAHVRRSDVDRGQADDAGVLSLADAPYMKIAQDDVLRKRPK